MSNQNPSYDFAFLATNFGQVPIEDVSFQPTHITHMEQVYNIEYPELETETPMNPSEPDGILIHFVSGECLQLNPADCASVEQYIREAVDTARRMMLAQQTTTIPKGKNTFFPPRH